MNRYIKYVTSLGFSGVTEAAQKNDPKLIRAFSYESHSSEQVRHTLGRAKKWKPGMLVFVPKAGRGIRVDAERKHIILGNGKKAVQALLRTVEDQPRGRRVAHKTRKG